jgi:hypothetical protein
MHYTQTAACQLLATHCACCGLPLLDAKSVEFGIGPNCRKHYGFDEISTKPDWYAGKTLAANFDPTLDVSTWTDARIACNRLVHHFALDPKGRKWVPECVYALGYIKLSEKMATRPGRIEVRAFPTGDPNPTHFVVKAKYQAGFYPRAFGGTWDSIKRTWTVPGASRTKLWEAIQRCFPGRILVTDTGVHEIPALAR